MERVYPELKSLCALHDRDLQFIDPHLGIKDAQSDDHGMPDVLLSSLRRCNSDRLQPLNMLVSGIDDFVTRLRYTMVGKGSTLERRWGLNSCKEQFAPRGGANSCLQ